jgi:drug/metabolite transporter (DMT)-like permease
MGFRKMIGVVLLAAGILALVYRGFTYTKQTHGAEMGPIKIELKEKERVEVPVWLGVALAVSGGALLALGKK